MNKRIIALCAAVLLITFGAIIFVVTKHDSSAQSDTRVVQASATINITKDGFIPKTLSVKTGTQVTWVNQDSAPHQVASDPYPSHTTVPGLFAKNPMAADETYSYTFIKAGNFGYHDQTMSTTTGVVQVQ